MRKLIPGVLVLSLGVQIALAQAPTDDKTLFYASFDDSLTPDIATGGWEAQASRGAACVKEGKFCGALRLPERSSVTYPLPGNLNPACGTVSMWIKTDWSGDDDASRTVFTFRGEGHNYLHINKIRTKRLGIAICGGPDDDWVWKRSDKEILAWKPGVWHHIAAVWREGEVLFYIDGEPVGEPVGEVRTPQGKIDGFALAGSGLTIDDLRVAGVVRSREEILAQATAPVLGRPYVYLSKLKPVACTQSLGKVGMDRRLRVDGMPMPLIIGNRIHARGIGVRAPASIAFDVPEGMAKLSAAIGLDELAGDGASVVFRVLGDGKELFKSERFTKGTPPRRIDIPLAGVKKLELIVDDGGDGSTGDLADWADAAFLRADLKGVPAPVSKFAKKTLDMYKRRRDAYVYAFDLEADGGYAVAAKNYLEDIDPAVAPKAFGTDAPLSTFAAPGEYEPICFVIYATKDLKDVRVEPTDLKSDAGTIPADRVDVRAVKRALYRMLYTRPPEQSEVISRFLEKRSPMDIEGQTFQEMHIIIHVPDHAKAGTYSGALRVSGPNCEATNVPVSIEVLPFKLRPLKRKRYGMYYRMSRNQEPPGRLEIELQDIREHGASILYPGFGIHYEVEDDKITPTYDEMREGLEVMKKLGFHGPIPIHDGFNRLAGLCGAKDINVKQKQTGDSLNTNEKFQAEARKALEGLLALQKDFPEFELLPSHMDEVLNRGRLPLYCNLAKPIRKFHQLRIYITLHNKPREGIPEMTQKLLPYVDVRCYNGHSMDDWIRAGHTFEELAKDLKDHNDEAWIYYNLRGSFFLAKWLRIVNGIYMWVSPITTHCIWGFQSFSGNPFDDTDGPTIRGHDFGLSFPDLADGKTPVPTRHWECYREGIDDMRYLCMLEDLIAEMKDKKPGPAAEAQKWLDALRASFPKAAEVADIELESPLLIAFSQKYIGDDYQQIRRTAADHIRKLLSGENE